MEAPTWFLLGGMLIAFAFRADRSTRKPIFNSFSGLCGAIFAVLWLSGWIWISGKLRNEPMTVMKAIMVSWIKASYAWAGYLGGLGTVWLIKRFRPRRLSGASIRWVQSRFGVHWLLTYTWLCLALPTLWALLWRGPKGILLSEGMFFWYRFAAIAFALHLGFIVWKLVSLKRAPSTSQEIADR